MALQFGDDLLHVRALARRLVRAAPGLRTMPAQRRAEAVASACARLLDTRDVLARALVHELEARTGLSVAMIRWGLETTLRTWTPAEVLALLDAAPREPGAPRVLAAVVLAGNVFTAAMRALCLPIAAGVTVLAKGSSADDVLPRYLEKALNAADPDVGACLKVVTFGRGEVGLDAALLSHADVVSVYGDDDTVEAWRSRMPAGARFLAHGHGLGVAYVAAEVLASEEAARDAAYRVALDVAAYDQRGCLSPHAVVVDATARVTPVRFAELLAEVGLADLEARLPLGTVPPDALAAQAQWRGVAAARGTLLARERWAVSFEGDAPLRPSPGYRNVGVYTCAGPTALEECVQPWSPHLKALGIAGDPAMRTRFAHLAPYVCDAGAMQTPPLGASLDGAHPFAGFARDVTRR